MAEHEAEEQECTIDNSQTIIQSKNQSAVKIPDESEWTTRESNMGLLETYQFEARAAEAPTRDLKGGACTLHFESGSCGVSTLPSPLNFASNCRCQCSCSPCPPQQVCPPSPPEYNSYPPFPGPVESCLPGLHQKYRDFYPDCKELHQASGYRNEVEHDDLYLPPSRPLSAASNYCNMPTSSRSWSPPSPSPLKCHCGAAQYRVSQPRATWDMPESMPCFQTFFQASPSPQGSSPRHPSRCESSLYLVDTPQASPRHQHHHHHHHQPRSKSSSPPVRRPEGRDVTTNISFQCSPGIVCKSFQTQKSGDSSPLSSYNLELSPDASPRSRRRLPSPCSPAYYPACYGNKPMDPAAARSLNPYAAELVRVEKHVECNCGPQRESLDQSYTRWANANPGVYDDSGASIRRVLRPESPLDLARSSRRLECTCQQHNKPAGQKSYTTTTQLPFPMQVESRSQSPAQSSLSIAQHDDADLNITTFLNEVKRILTSDVPPKLSPTVRKEGYNSRIPESPSRESDSSARRSKDRKSMLSSSGRAGTWQDENPPSTDYFARVKSTLKSAVPVIDGRTNRSTTRDQFHFRAPGWEQEVPSSRRTMERKQDWEIVSSGRRTTDRKQAEWEVSSKQGSEFPSTARATDRKQWEFPSHLDWEFPVQATDRKQEYASCVRTTERGSSPIIVTPTPRNSGPNSARAGPEAAGRPKMASTGMNCEAQSASGGRHDEATSRAQQAKISPPSESEEEYRHGTAVVPKAADPAKRSFNKRECARQPNREVIRQCCCGMCRSTYSRSHFTTKCPFCASVHSCCCGMCSCPFPSCTSKSLIPDSSNTSNDTSSVSSPGNDKLPLDHRNNNSNSNSNYPGFSSRPKSLSPMRRTYLAGLGQRSKSSRSKCKLPPRVFEPSPRALLESFHNYLKSESRRSKAGPNPHRRCSDRRPSHWSPDRHCSQQAMRVSTRRASRGPHQQLQAPWGTHPLLLSSKPASLEYRLPYTGSHRGCCCPLCVNGKL